VEKCKTEENLSKFSNNMAYNTVTSIVLWKEILCKTWIVFILIKCICFIIKINHVWSRVKNIALKTHCFPEKKPIVFQHVHFFIPLIWNEKLSLHVTHRINLYLSDYDKAFDNITRFSQICNYSYKMCIERLWQGIWLYKKIQQNL